MCRKSSVAHARDSFLFSGIGYFSPEECDDLDVYCDYNPLPSFEFLKEAYETRVAGELLDMDEYTPSAQRAYSSKCPKDYPALDSINWDKVDNAPNLKCPRVNLFQCTATGFDYSAQGVYMQNEDYEFKMQQLKSHHSLLTWKFALFVLCIGAAVFVIKKAKCPNFYRTDSHSRSHGWTEKDGSTSFPHLQKYGSLDDEGYGTLSSDSSSSDGNGHDV